MVLGILSEKHQFFQTKILQQNMLPCSQLDITKAKYLAVLNSEKLISLTSASEELVEVLFSISPTK